MKEIVKSLAILVYIDVIHKIYEINAYQIAHNAEQAIIVMFIILNLISVYPVMKNVWHVLVEIIESVLSV